MQLFGCFSVCSSEKTYATILLLIPNGLPPNRKVFLSTMVHHPRGWGGALLRAKPSRASTSFGGLLWAKSRPTRWLLAFGLEKPGKK
jgi:hypothetical protein